MADPTGGTRHSTRLKKKERKKLLEDQPPTINTEAFETISLDYLAKANNVATFRQVALIVDAESSRILMASRLDSEQEIVVAATIGAYARRRTSYVYSWK